MGVLKKKQNIIIIADLTLCVDVLADEMYKETNREFFIQINNEIFVLIFFFFTLFILIDYKLA